MSSDRRSANQRTSGCLIMQTSVLRERLDAHTDGGGHAPQVVLDLSDARDVFGGNAISVTRSLTRHKSPEMDDAGVDENVRRPGRGPSLLADHRLHLATDLIIRGMGACPLRIARQQGLQ